MSTIRTVASTPTTAAAPDETRWAGRDGYDQAGQLGDQCTGGKTVLVVLEQLDRGSVNVRIYERTWRLAAGGRADQPVRAKQRKEPYGD